MKLQDQFQGGIDPAQDHSPHSSDTMETRLVRYACRVAGFDDLGDPVIQDGSEGDVNCGLHWPAGERPIGGWAGIWPTVGGSTVKSGGGSSSANDAAMQAAQAGPKVGGVNGQAAAPGVQTKKIGGVTYTYDPTVGVWRTGYVNVRSALGLFGINLGSVGVSFKWSAADREGYNTGLYEIGGRGFTLNGLGSGKSGGMGGAAGPAGAGGNAGGIVNLATSSQRRPPVVTSESVPSTAVGINLYPVKNSDGSPDTKFVQGGAPLPGGWPSIVPGSRGAVLAGTEHTGQYPVYLHADPRMVAVNAGPDPDAGSVVYDTDGQGNYDPGRFGRLQSLIRVMPPFTGSLDFGRGGTLAHQHARGERDGVAGYGAYVDLSSAAAVSISPVTTPTGSGPVTTPGVSGSTGPGISTWNGNLSTLGTYMNQALMDQIYRAAQKAAAVAASKVAVKGPNDSARSVEAKVLNAPVLTVGLQSARVGGPIEPGHGKKDKHRVGQSGESAVNVGHLATGAPWYADMTRDGPLPFEKPFFPNDVAEFPLKSYVHLQYAPGEATGSYAFGPHIGPHPAGVWKLWAEVPEMKEGGDIPPPRKYEPTDPDPPPPTRPPPPTTPSNPTPAPTRRDIFWWLGGSRPLGAATGAIGGGSWRGAGATSRDDLMAFKGAGLGSPMGVQVRNPDRSRAARRGIGIGPVDLPKSGIPIEPIARVSTMLPMGQRKTIGLRPDTVTSFPQAVSFTTILSRPTDLRKSMPDIRSSGDIDGERLRAIMRGLPVVLREEAWGAFNGTTFTATQGYGASRYGSPTSAGGKVFMPPELDMKDIEAGSSPFTASASYVLAYTGVHWASGIPVLTTGGIKTGYQWTCENAGTLNFDQVSSAGVITTGIFGGTNTSQFYFRETGGPQAIKMGAIADGGFLRRVSTSIVSTAPPTGWGTPTGTLSRASFDASTVTATTAYQTLAALVTDLLTMGIIKA